MLGTASVLFCLESAMEQGHHITIQDAAFRAAFIDGDYARAYYLYALAKESDPDTAAIRLH
jgi:hypothetical protein